ncbi:ATP-dependent Clp protease proteolytic subunit-like isoform X2 [Watersipora subatra]|uniref:ATP-dependent Clp protease proteolytic subunit-like isoform X2 n=1 Tax=Watersipora subatra TaxID=2589382 RepID=UPI00355AE08A
MSIILLLLRKPLCVSGKMLGRVMAAKLIRSAVSSYGAHAKTWSGLANLTGSKLAMREFHPVYVMDPNARPATQKDVFSYELGNSRTIILSDEITPRVASSVVSALINLAQYPQWPINMNINCTEPHVTTSALAIYDAIDHVKAERGATVVTSGFSFMTTPAILILAAGTHGHRHAYKTTRFVIEPLIPQIITTTRRTTDQKKDATENATNIRKRFHTLLAHHSLTATRATFENLEKEYNVFDAEEAKRLGLIDYIIN